MPCSGLLLTYQLSIKQLMLVTCTGFYWLLAHFLGSACLVAETQQMLGVLTCLLQTGNKLQLMKLPAQVLAQICWACKYHSQHQMPDDERMVT
jgi:hypothetical protein